MNKTLLFVLVVLVGLPFATSCPVAITACGCDLDITTGAYRLSNDIAHTGATTCLNVTADYVSLDMNKKSINLTGGYTAGSIGILVGAKYFTFTGAKESWINGQQYAAYVNGESGTYTNFRAYSYVSSPTLVYVNNTQKAQFSDGVLITNGTAFYALNAPDTEVTGMLITSNSTGIYFYGNATDGVATSNTVNTSASSGTGIYFQNTFDAVAIGNTVTCKDGACILATTSRNTTIGSNTLNSIGKGVALSLTSSSNNSTIYSNTASAVSAIACQLSASSDNRFYSNTCSNTGGSTAVSMFVFLGSVRNQIYSNAFSAQNANVIHIPSVTGVNNTFYSNTITNTGTKPWINNTNQQQNWFNTT